MHAPKIALSFVSIAIAVAPAAQAATMVFTSQDRFVEAHVNEPNGTSDSQFVAAPNFGFFNQPVLAHLSLPIGLTGSGVQTSSLSPTLIDAYVGASALYGNSLPGGTSEGTSHFLVSFTLNEESQFHFVGTRTGAFSDIAFSLTGPSGPVFMLDSEVLDYDITGTMAPGAYTMLAQSSELLTGPGVKTASLDFTFELVPAPGVISMVAAGMLMCRRRARGKG